MTAQQNKKECEQLARRVFTIAELLQHLQDPDVLRRPEIRRPLTGLDDTLREAHELVMACQDKSTVYSHMYITRRLDRMYNILLPTNTPVPSTSALSMPPNPVPAAQFVWRGTHGVKEFTFKELATATNNFSPDRMIGGGGFATVYMGMLPDGREVAIKRMLRTSYVPKRDFMTELSNLRSVSHENIVRVFGSCVREKRQLLSPFRKKQEELLLVLEYIENGTLDSHLYGPRSSSPVMTSWKTRIEILLGVSRAIEYMQSCGERPVIHRVIKPSNMLLDASWAPRLSDFLLALTSEGPEHVVDHVIGTIGYLAPEYLTGGFVNPTIDIYSFGVVMLQVLRGKKPYFSKEESEEEKTEECEEEDKREECEQEGKNTEEDKEENEQEEEEKTFLTEKEWQLAKAVRVWSPRIGVLRTDID
uniref:Protein kinase domain-containing protein n=1 Tax=Oryza punctata TaxID=4537 RepID=A0A0E0MHY7_ORYPU